LVYALYTVPGDAQETTLYNIIGFVTVKKYIAVLYTVLHQKCF